MSICIMEAGDAFQASKAITWKGDWDLFKRKFRAVARLSGMDSAIKLAEKLASEEDLATLVKGATR